MDVEKIFRPSKWFVFFCGLLVFVWIIYQAVSNLRVSGEAEVLARRMYTWNWAQIHFDSRVENVQSKVLKKTDTEAVVLVKGTQILTVASGHEVLPGAKSETVPFQATFRFYKSSNYWVLGRLEFD